MVLNEGSIFLSRDASDDNRPIDLQCRAACDNNTECVLAHSMVRVQAPQTKPSLCTPHAPRLFAFWQVETYSLHNLAHNLPPPPQPPAPPKPPPPNVPPLPPNPPAPPPDGAIGLRTWSPATYNSRPEGTDAGSDALFHIYCGFGDACGGFRASFFASFSQTATLTTARKLIDQGTYRDSVCPYECGRRVIHHEVVPTNENNLFGGIGLDGERLNYAGWGQSRMGFSRFEFGIGIGDPVPVLKMAYNVSMDECQDIMERHKLVAPHGVWLIHPSLQDTPNLAAAERIGDCGLFLVTRTVVDFRLWRAFYDYSRFVMRLGHFDAWLDSDVRTAAVGSSSEAECSGSTSRVCIFWSEFDLDEQEFSCRPNHEASNVITPTKLLLALENNDVAYPPPNPPPPEPPSAPPHPSPPPGELRCELSAIATTQGRKVPGATRGAGDAAVQQAGEMYELVDQKCWRWDPANNWPPFVAHRDIYNENPRCGDARSRDIQWGGGFSQSLMPKDTYDPNEQNNNDCALVDMNTRADDADRINRHELVYTIEAGSNCFDKTGIKRDQPRLCELGTNAQSCGVHNNLVVFGFVSNYGIAAEGEALRCINRVNGRSYLRLASQYRCMDGGPGSLAVTTRDDEDSTFQCYYGTDPLCGRRRFAFLAEEAGPDVPDDSCRDTMHNPPRYGANNGRCTRLQ